MINSTTTSQDGRLITGEFLPMKWITETPPEHEFCVDPLFPIGAVTLLNAHGGTGKSLFALKAAVHIALGLPIINAQTNDGKVAYMSLEDSENILRNRIYKIVNELSEVRERADKLTSNFMIIDRYGIQTHMAEYDNYNIVTAQVANDLSVLLKENKIKCIFVDTFIRTNTLNENDNAQMGALLVTFEQVAKEVECAVVLLHHLPKTGAPKNYAARGASAITDNARSVLLMEIVSTDDADKFSEENVKISVLAGRLIRVIHTKHNYSAAHPEQYLEMSPKGVLLEVFPTSSSKSNLELRYLELYNWWVQVWKRQPLTRTHIEQNVESIRPPKANHGKDQYKKALDRAIEKGLAKEVPAPEGGSKNSKAKYYTLLPDVSDDKD